MRRKASGRRTGRRKFRSRKRHGRRVRAKLLTWMDRLREVRKKWKDLGGSLNERARRLWAASEAKTIGPGAVSLVARATGLSRGTTHKGLRELESGELAAEERVRRRGGGRKQAQEVQKELVPALEALVDPTARGHPISPLRWTIKSTRILSDELKQNGFEVSHSTVGKLLDEMGYSLQGTRKTREGSQHPDRDAQFRYINALVQKYQRRGQPVVSVDAKKKENVGDFANRGREWRPKGQPEKVRTHDFVDKELGKVTPYGVYDLAQNEGFVNVGVTHDTPEFAVATLRQWWRMIGSRAYSKAKELLVTADCGGSNGYRPHVWKVELQRLAYDLGLNIRIAHFPPGTSKWNKIEHRMFCHIANNWRGKPLSSLEVIVSLIGATKTRQGLKIEATLDEHDYPKGRKATPEEMADLALVRDNFHGEWNYTLCCKKQH